jgi:hypothetical protein
MSFSTSILLKLHAPSDDVACDSPDKPGRMCRVSVQLYKTNITLMWPLSRQGMIYTFITADNTAAALYILNIIIVTSFQWITTKGTSKRLFKKANRWSASHSVPCLLQNTCVHYYFHHSLTHTLSSNILTHLSSVLTFILHWTTSLLGPICLVHFRCHADTPNWGTKKWDTDK